MLTVICVRFRRDINQRSVGEIDGRSSQEDRLPAGDGDAGNRIGLRGDRTFFVLPEAPVLFVLHQPADQA